jgi:hypothetical protein
MSDTLGAWARLEMGAFCAGVFWGVLVSMALAGVGVGRVTIVMAVVCMFSSGIRCEDRWKVEIKIMSGSGSRSSSRGNTPPW